MLSHEASSTAGLVGALRTKTADGAIGFDGVVLQHGELNLAMLMRLLLGGLVDLLLTLLATSAKTKDQVNGGFLLNVVVSQSTTVLELLTGEDETLLIRGDS